MFLLHIYWNYLLIVSYLLFPSLLSVDDMGLYKCVCDFCIEEIQCAPPVLTFGISFL